MSPQLFTGREEITSLRDLSRLSKKSLPQNAVRLIKGKEAIGYFIPEDEIDLFLERAEVIENGAWTEWEKLRKEKSKHDGKKFLEKLTI